MDEKRYDPYTGYEIKDEEYEESRQMDADRTYGNPQEDREPADESVPEQTSSANGIAIAAMILGIVSVVLMLTCCCSPIAIITGIAAIVCFAVSPKIDGKRETKATAGLICAIVSIVGTVLLIMFFVFNVFLSSDFQKSFQEGFNQEFNDTYEEYSEDYDDSI